MRILFGAIFACLMLVSPFAFSDNQRPTTIDGVQARGEAGPAITVTWNGGQDNVGIVGYNIYRDNQYYDTVIDGHLYTDQNIEINRQYTYQVVAFDRVHNFSEKSLSASATSDTVKGGNIESSSGGSPEAPSGIRVDAQSDTSVKLSWNESVGGADGYNIYINDSYVTTVRGRNEYVALGLDQSRDHNFYIYAFRNGIYSTRSEIVTASAVPLQITPPPYYSGSKSAVPDGYSLVFADDFNRTSIDSTKWSSGFMWGTDMIINNEEQYYVDVLNDPEFGTSPFRFTGDKLIIESNRTPDWLRSKAQNQRYLSGAMTTYDKHFFKYGYFEMRAMLPPGRGLWPAFWLYYDHKNSTGREPEIDIMEQLGQATRTVYQTYHWKENGNPRRIDSYPVQGPDFSIGYHTFGLLWEPGRLTWYVDGVKTTSFESSTVSDERMYLAINLATGGSWVGSPDANTQFPAQFNIDYVRAYQKQ